MWGALFESVYEGSLVGAGAPVFAVYSYVLARQAKSRKYGATIELNPKLLSMILGEDERTILEAIERLCQPDPENQNQEQKGRRLVRVDKFTYQVVQGSKFLAMQKEEERREQNRRAQRRHRGRPKEEKPDLKPKPKPTPLQEQFQAQMDPPLRECCVCGTMSKSCTFEELDGLIDKQPVCSPCRLQLHNSEVVEQPFAEPVMLPPPKPAEAYPPMPFIETPPLPACKICGRPHGPGGCPAL